MTAFLLTVNTSTASHDPADQAFLTEQAKRTSQGRRLKDSRWSTYRRHGFTAGDRIYMLLQGAGPRGLIGSGFVRDGEVYDEESWRNDGSLSHYLGVEWEAFVDSSNALHVDQLRRIAPATHWRPQGSGTKIAQTDEAAVESAWAIHLHGLGVPPVPIEVTRSYTNAVRKVRRHQQKFRGLLLQHYPQECAHSTFAASTVTRAAGCDR